MKATNHSAKLIILTTLLSLVGTAAFAQEAQQGGQAPQGGQAQGQQVPLSPPDVLRLPIFKKLKLDKKQKAAIQEIQKNNQASFDAYRNAMHKAKQEFDQSMDGVTSDDVVRERFRAFQQTSDAFMNSGFEQAMAIRKILTPKQREKFRQLKATMFDQARRQGQAPPPREDYESEE